MIRIQKDKKVGKYATTGCKNRQNQPEEQEATAGCVDEAPRAKRLFREKSEDVTEDFHEESPRPSKKARKEKPSAFSAALRILQAGANSSMMLREKLTRKGYEKEEIEEAIAEVKAAGLCDDKRLLFSHVEYLARRKYYGKARIYPELLRKFDRKLVTRYFEEATDEIDFIGYATYIAKKKDTGKGRAALITLLKRQGYESHEIREALIALKESSEE